MHRHWCQRRARHPGRVSHPRWTGNWHPVVRDSEWCEWGAISPVERVWSAKLGFHQVCALAAHSPAPTRRRRVPPPGCVGRARASLKPPPLAVVMPVCPGPEFSPHCSLSHTVQCRASSLLPTDGGLVVTLAGTNFGALPVGTEVAATLVSSSSGASLRPTCTVATPHLTLACTTPPGVGVGYVWQVTVGGQTSAVSTFLSAFAPPSLVSQG